MAPRVGPKAGGGLIRNKSLAGRSLRLLGRRKNGGWFHPPRAGPKASGGLRRIPKSLYHKAPIPTSADECMAVPTKAPQHRADSGLPGGRAKSRLFRLDEFEAKAVGFTEDHLPKLGDVRRNELYDITPFDARRRWIRAGWLLIKSPCDFISELNPPLFA